MENFNKLQNYLRQRIPNAQLTVTLLPNKVKGQPVIQLHLLNADYPQASLTAQQATDLMDNPPYWAFCWASGQVLAQYLLKHSYLVKGKTVLDFGAGSGVVAIAAKLAGAERAIACDLDQQALEVCQINAQLNNVELEYSNDWSNHTNQQFISKDISKSANKGEKGVSKDTEIDLICVADVFYDRANLPLLSSFSDNSRAIIVADSRLKGQPLEGLNLHAIYDSHTVPDLNESSDFNKVAIYK